MRSKVGMQSPNQDILKARVKKILDILEHATASMPQPMTQLIIKDFGRDPYLILISCLLSLRARDAQTYLISKSLFNRAKTPQEMVQIPLEELATLFMSIGFYRRKALIIHDVSKELLERFKGKVPNTEEELLSLPGVGRKTANLVLGYAFNIPAICVDTHVHRVSNRLGLVQTKTPEETEQALKEVVPQERWIDINTYLVIWGQQVCVPISPFCSICELMPVCPRRGVTKSR